MIGALWGRWFDAREFRRARDVAEQNYQRVLIRVAELVSENSALRRGSAAADALDLTLGATQAALDEAKGRIKELERRLDDIAAEKSKAFAIVDRHADVSKLPPAPNRDREALHRLTDENETLRAHREHCLKEHR